MKSTMGRGMGLGENLDSSFPLYYSSLFFTSTSLLDITILLDHSTTRPYGIDNKDTPGLCHSACSRTSKLITFNPVGLSNA